MQDELQHLRIERGAMVTAAEDDQTKMPIGLCH